jgi:hypothetical protein
MSSYSDAVAAHVALVQKNALSRNHGAEFEFAGIDPTEKQTVFNALNSVITELRNLVTAAHQARQSVATRSLLKAGSSQDAMDKNVADLDSVIIPSLVATIDKASGNKDYARKWHETALAAFSELQTVIAEENLGTLGYVLAESERTIANMPAVTYVSEVVKDIRSDLPKASNLALILEFGFFGFLAIKLAEMVKR